jgi:hypothetical protein
MTTNQRPSKDLLELILRVCAWVARIPIIVMILFAILCAAFTGIMFVLRLTSWVFTHGLSDPW